MIPVVLSPVVYCRNPILSDLMHLARLGRWLLRRYGRRYGMLQLCPSRGTALFSLPFSLDSEAPTRPHAASHSWHQSLGTSLLAPVSWHQSIGTSLLAPVSWHQSLGTSLLALVSWPCIGLILSPTWRAGQRRASRAFPALERVTRHQLHSSRSVAARSAASWVHTGLGAAGAMFTPRFAIHPLKGTSRSSGLA